MIWYKISKIYIVFIFLINLKGFVSSISLDENGGYSIVMAIEPSTLEFDNFDEYINKLRATLVAFSTNLYKATDENFFLKKVDFLLPINWIKSSTYENSTTQSYESADIRLTNTNVPLVENNNPCGLPGSFIELPLRFLDRSQPQTFGEPSKALLNPWARFRWGIWEEHGDSRSKIFTNFYKNSEEWVTTSCSDQKLEGFKTDSIGNSCGDDGEIYPSEDCRFRPLPTNTATTSIMSFHWLDSVTNFCNDTNHNKIAPNRQNIFCEHQSAWSILIKSDDYAKLVEKKELPLPVPEFNILKPNIKPALYLLLDRGAFTANDQAAVIIPAILKSLVEFYENDALKGTLTSIGSFPSINSNEVVQNLISWLKITTDDLDDIFDAIGSVIINPIKGDFISAIRHVADDINKLNPMGGAVLLIIKTGSGEGYFNSNIYEEELLLTLKKNRISVFAAELQNTNNNFPNHLVNLAVKTDSKHVSLTNLSSSVLNMQELLSSVLTKLSAPISSSSNKLLIHKSKITPSTNVNVPLMEGLIDVEIILKFPRYTTSGQILIGGKQVTFSFTQEWGETLDGGRRNIYTVNPGQVDDLPDELVIQYSCFICPTGGGILTVYGIPTPGDDIENIQVTVSTSAQNNVVDFSKSFSDLAPFTIYAKVEKDSKPVRGLLVTAEVISPNEQVSIVNLADNGLGTPDVASLDGIYSTIFLPSRDDSYRISIKVQTIKTSLYYNDVINVHGVGRLLPIDQGEIEQKETIELENKFSSIFEYNGQISFINTDIYVNKLNQPVKILDLFATFSKTDKEVIKLTFTSPTLLKGEGKSTQYIVQGGKTLDSLLPGGTDYEEVFTTSDIQAPENIEEFEIPVLLTENLIYFQIWAIHKDEGSGLENKQTSNIVQVMPYVDDGTTDTTITTSGTESTISSETESTISSETESTISSETESTISSETESTISSETKSTISSETESTISSETESTISSETKSTISSETESTISSQTESTISSETESTISSVTDDSTIPSDTESTVSSKTDPTKAPTFRPTEEPTTDKPFFKTAGGIVVIILIVLLVVGGAGGGYWFYKKKYASGNNFSVLETQDP